MIIIKWFIAICSQCLRFDQLPDGKIVLIDALKQLARDPDAALLLLGL